MSEDDGAPPVGSTASTSTPPADVAIDDRLVRRLLHAQHPDLAERPLRLLDTGWDNVTMRLGDDLLVRLPRRAEAAALIVHEQRWLAELAPRLPLEIPSPVRVGRPFETYPWHWSVVPFFEGKTADLEEPGVDQAEVLGAFLRALHTHAPPDAPRNPVRGVALEARRVAIEARLERLEAVTSSITPVHRALWRRALAAPIDTEPRWLHGDLHPRNVVVAAGRFAAIIDWGDVTAGDVATDLASVWMLFEAPEVRARVFESYGPVSDATLARARGWAIGFGATLLETGRVDHPQHRIIGERVLSRLVGDV